MYSKIKFTSMEMDFWTYGKKFPKKLQTKQSECSTMQVGVQLADLNKAVFFE